MRSADGGGASSGVKSLEDEHAMKAGSKKGNARMHGVSKLTCKVTHGSVTVVRDTQTCVLTRARVWNAEGLLD